MIDNVHSGDGSRGGERFLCHHSGIVDDSHGSYGSIPLRRDGPPVRFRVTSTSGVTMAHTKVCFLSVLPFFQIMFLK